MLTCDDAPLSRSPATLNTKALSHFLSQLSPGQIGHFGQTGVVAHGRDSRCTWSEAPWTCLNGTVHAAQACTVPSGQAGTVREKFE
jgi:hypothetical protein